MQQFTRALTREIEIGGERLALTLSKEGLSVRPVGGRRPPHAMSWEACLCACVAKAGQEPAAEQVQDALKAVRAGGTAKPSESAVEEPSASAATPSPVPHPAEQHVSHHETHEKPHHETHEKSHHETHEKPYHETHEKPYHETHEKPHHETHEMSHHETHELHE